MVPLLWAPTTLLHAIIKAFYTEYKFWHLGSNFLEKLTLIGCKKARYRAQHTGEMKPNKQMLES